MHDRVGCIVCRPIVQIPWAVNALGAAHSIPGESCKHHSELRDYMLRFLMP